MNQTTTQESGSSKSRSAIMEEAERLEENCLFTSKGHYHAAKFWSKFHQVTGLTIAVLAAAVGTSAFAQLQPQTPFALFGGVISFAVAVIAAIAAYIKPNEKASTHQSCGNNFDALLTRARMFRTIDCWSAVSEEILTERLRLLCEERSRLKATSPQVPYGAYQKAKKSIEAGEASYAVDAKPKNARKGKQSKNQSSTGPVS